MEEEELIGEEDEYDALNDETFGADATGGDWEQDHEKLAQITESCRQQPPSLPLHKVDFSHTFYLWIQGTQDFSYDFIFLRFQNGIEIDIEDSLSHLVLDDRDGTIPRPGVWDSPTNLPLPRPQQQQRPPLPTTSLKNVRTVEELERGLIASRPPPGLGKPPLPPLHHQQQHQQVPGAPFIFDSLPMNELQMKGLPPPRFPPGLGLPGPPVVLSAPVRQPPPQFMQHHRLLPSKKIRIVVQKRFCRKRANIHLKLKFVDTELTKRV